MIHPFYTPSITEVTGVQIRCHFWNKYVVPLMGGLAAVSITVLIIGILGLMHRRGLLNAGAIGSISMKGIVAMIVNGGSIFCFSLLYNGFFLHDAIKLRKVVRKYLENDFLNHCKGTGAISQGFEKLRRAHQYKNAYLRDEENVNLTQEKLCHSTGSGIHLIWEKNEERETFHIFSFLKHAVKYEVRLKSKHFENLS